MIEKQEHPDLPVTNVYNNGTGNTNFTKADAERGFISMEQPDPFPVNQVDGTSEYVDPFAVGGFLSRSKYIDRG